MQIRRYKILFGLCMCKGCMKLAVQHVEKSYQLDDGYLTVSLDLCEEHATELLLDPFWR